MNDSIQKQDEKYEYKHEKLNQLKFKLILEQVDLG